MLDAVNGAGCAFKEEGQRKLLRQVAAIAVRESY